MKINILLKKYKKNQKAFLLFSGGLDTTFLLHFFTHQLKWEITPVYIDVGDDQNKILALKKLAKKIGAKNFLLVNSLDEFVNKYCSLAILANGRYQDSHPLSSSLSRPLMIKELNELTEKFKINYLINGSNIYQNNWARFELALKYLKSKLIGLTPIREYDLLRKEMKKYLEDKNIFLKKGLFSSDINIWGKEIEDGQLEDIWWEKDNDLFDFKTKKKLPQIQITLEYKNGLPVAYCNQKLNLKVILNKVNFLGSKYKFGFFDCLESRSIGIKEREVHFSPAADLLITGHRDLEISILSEGELFKKNQLDNLWNLLVCHGFWFNQKKLEIDKEILKMNKNINGTVRFDIFPQGFRISGRKINNKKISQKLKKISLDEHIKNIHKITLI